MKRTKSIYLALLAVLLSPMAANAIPIEVTGQGAADGSWEITLVTGSFNDNSALLMEQVWWGDELLSVAFADALGPVTGVNQLGLGIGPIFAYETQITSGTNLLRYGAWTDGSGANSFTFSGEVFDVALVFATAERLSVPEPGTLALLGFGLVGMAARRRKTV